MINEQLLIERTVLNSILPVITDADRLAALSLFRKTIPVFSSDPQPDWKFLRTWTHPASKSTFLQKKGFQGMTAGALESGAPVIITQSIMNKAVSKSGRLPKNAVYSKEHLKYSQNIRELSFLAVDPHYQRKGIASELIKVLEEQYKKQGVTILFGDVDDKDNYEAVATFYDTQGFTLDTELPEFFRLEWGAKVLNRWDSNKQYHPPTFYFFKDLSV